MKNSRENNKQQKHQKYWTIIKQLRKIACRLCIQKYALLFLFFIFLVLTSSLIVNNGINKNLHKFNIINETKLWEKSIRYKIRLCKR